MVTEVEPHDPDALSPGATVPGEHRVEELFAKGRLGAAYVVRSASGERRAANVLHREHARDLGEWFLTTARLRQSLEHPHLPRTWAAGALPDGRPVEVTELLEGESLREALANRSAPLPLAVVARVVRELASALDHLHGRAPPVVHRALTPENVLLTAPDGLVKLLGVGEADRPRFDAVRPSYQSPEALADIASLSPRADVFVLASVAYEALTGRPAFPGAPDDILGSLHAGARPSAHAARPEVPEAADALLRRCWELSPDRRPATATEAARAFTAALGVEDTSETRAAPREPTGPVEAPLRVVHRRNALLGPTLVDSSAATRSFLESIENTEVSAVSPLPEAPPSEPPPEAPPSPPPPPGTRPSVAPRRPATGRAPRAVGAPRVVVPPPPSDPPPDGATRTLDDPTGGGLDAPSASLTAGGTNPYIPSIPPPPADLPPAPETSSPFAQDPSTTIDTLRRVALPEPAHDATPHDATPRVEPPSPPDEPTGRFDPPAPEEDEFARRISSPPVVLSPLVAPTVPTLSGTGAPPAPARVDPARMEPAPGPPAPGPDLLAVPPPSPDMPATLPLPSDGGAAYRAPAPLHAPPRSPLPPPSAPATLPVQSARPDPSPASPDTLPPPRARRDAPAPRREAPPDGVAFPDEPTKTITVVPDAPPSPWRSPLVIASIFLANAIVIVGVAHAIALVANREPAVRVVQAPAPLCAPCAACPAPPPPPLAAPQPAAVRPAPPPAPRAAAPQPAPPRAPQPARRTSAPRGPMPFRAVGLFPQP